MKMIIQLLVASVAVGLSVAQDPPAYKENLQALREATINIQTNLLSMKGDIPLLNDSRRHYAEIVNVINYHGLMLSRPWSTDLMAPYYEYYDANLNVSAPEAISNPQKVVKDISNLQDAVYKKSHKVISLIDDCILIHMNDCNGRVESIVRENDLEYGLPSSILLAAGKAASIYNDLNKQFEEISKNFAAHHFVITSSQDLEDIVYAVAHVHQLVNRLT